ncbi:hypothetical protein [Bradyrhizobium niftali]|uniref:hypothetical protein n=1 Tax=Bradyrhizobium niftali TaxID=2560055 RepID=UPI0014311956|nr:hypothetical protein [Bradyrhizobium niftali]
MLRCDFGDSRCNVADESSAQVGLSQTPRSESWVRTVVVIATIAVSAREIAGRMAKAQAGFGMLAIRAVEVAASVAIVAFGVLLLAGYMATEQFWMFSR